MPGSGPAPALADAAQEGVIRIWAMDDAALLDEFPGRSPDLAATQGGELLIYKEGLGDVVLRDLAAAAIVARLEAPTGRPLAVSPDGRRLVVGSASGVLRVWELAAP